MSCSNPARVQNRPFLDTTPWFLTIPCPKSTLFVHRPRVFDYPVSKITLIWTPPPGFWPSRVQNHPNLDTAPGFLTIQCPKSTLFVHRDVLPGPSGAKKVDFGADWGAEWHFGAILRDFGAVWGLEDRLGVKKGVFGAGKELEVHSRRNWRSIRGGTGGPFGGGGNNKKGLAHCQPFFNRSAGAHQLKAVLGRNCEFLAAVTATRCENAAAVCSSHTLTETVLVDSLAT